MQAITCPSFGSPDVMRWGEVPTPKPDTGEVLIKVAAAGLNRADLMQRQGKYPPPPGASDILGLEVSGEVVACGERVQRWKVGDKVCALLSGGGYAEYVAVAESQCLPVPIDLSMREAAALPEAVATVWVNLFEVAHLKTTDTVLVHGGSSGIGTTAIQMVELFGAKIFVTVGNEDKAAACRKLGADFVVNHAKEDFVEAVQAATKGQGVNVVLDMVGGDYLNRNLMVLAPFGTHVSIATQRGAMASIDMRLVMQKRLTITGSTLRNRPQAEKARIIEEIRKNAWGWVAESRLKPLIFQYFPLKNAAEAHKVMESGAQIGKIVLEVMS